MEVPLRSPSCSACLVLSRLVLVCLLCLTPSLANKTLSSSSSLLSSRGLQEIFARALTSSNTTSTFGDLAKALNRRWPEGEASSSSPSFNVSSCLATSATSPDDVAKCLASKGQCLSLTEVASLYGKDKDSTLNPIDAEVMSPALLFSVMSCEESRARGHDEEDADKTPSSKSSWGYSFLFVTLINLCSLTGALVLPCMKLRIYKRLLMFMVALAVGTLAGSGLLFLIPEAFHLVHDGDTGYIWKSTMIIGGVYLFYLIEKLLREVNAKRENTKRKRRQDELATEGQFSTSFQRHTIHNPIPEKNPDTIPDNITNGICSSVHRHAIPYKTVSDSSSVANSQDLVIAVPRNGINNEDIAGQTSTASTPEDKSSSAGSVDVQNNPGHQKQLPSAYEEVAPVAYMIIFGDALHNFIDGLSIGSAFTQNVMTGVSVSVAVMCEELPHELGDFAILLNSGMSIRKAILYNFLSACTCYLGLFIGITLGENTQSHEWIFALAGGMFLYISLVDMLPEMNASSESAEGLKLGKIKVFIIHNLGLLTGYAIMLVMALYSGNITFE